MGKAVISTSVGAEGIDHTDGKNILLANTVSEFVDQMVGLHQEPERVAAIGKEANRLVRKSYSDEPLVADLLAFYKRIPKA